jgi:hypothetical protein
MDDTYLRAAELTDLKDNHRLGAWARAIVRERGGEAE